MYSETAIKVANISKCYQIYDKPHDRLKQFFYPRLQRWFGKAPKQYFREFWALKDVSFEIKKGETVGIIGCNGSGKSTLLQLICGTLHPTAGSIETKGRIAALLELGSGFNPEFTGRENVYMNATILGLSRTEIDACFDDIVTFAGIGDFIEQPIKIYSSGMMVRLAFAVIAHVNADILVVDEALAVGDAFFTQKCMRFLRNFMQTGTVLFVSHDTGAVVNLCSKAILLDQGEVIKIEAPKNVTEYYLAIILKQQEEAAKMHSIASTEKNIESRAFNSEQALGSGGAKIISVELLDRQGKPLLLSIGGEEVILSIKCLVCNSIASPIIGFQFRDRLGQVIFAENTFSCQFLQSVKEGDKLVANFEFNLPVLPTGDYSLGVAIADGTQYSHIQLHWIHDALMIRAQAAEICYGLIGIPMRKIALEVL